MNLRCLLGHDWEDVYNKIVSDENQAICIHTVDKVCLRCGLIDDSRTREYYDMKSRRECAEKLYGRTE